MVCKAGTEVALPTRGGSSFQKTKNLSFSDPFPFPLFPTACLPLMWLLSNPNTHLHSLMLQLLG